MNTPQIPQTGPYPLTALLPGEQAPDFTLNMAPGVPISLNSFLGAPVILAFYPADWSPVCSDQLAVYNEILPEFEKYGAQLLGISVDGVWCHQAFAEIRNIRFPLLSDFEPKGAVAKSFGVFRNDDGFCERALFVLDASGKVVWSHVSQIDVNPGADMVFGALDSIPQLEPVR